MPEFRLLPLDRVFSSTNSIVPNDRLECQGKLSHLRNTFSPRQQSSSPDKSNSKIYTQSPEKPRIGYQQKLSEAQYQWVNRLSSEAGSCPVSASRSDRQEYEEPSNTFIQRIQRPTSAKTSEKHVKCIKFDSISHSWVEGYRRAEEENPHSLRKYLIYEVSFPSHAA